MKICWDNLEKYNIYLTKKGNFRSKEYNATFYYKEECKVCGKSFLAHRNRYNFCSYKCSSSGENNGMYGKVNPIAREKTIEWMRKYGNPMKNPEIAKKFKGKNNSQWKGNERIF